MDILIFDMDGVLIDVSQSYRKTIQLTIHIYLEQCLGLRAKLVSPEEISLFKSVGGFNNDWDLTAGFLHYLLSVSGIPPLPRQKKLASPSTIIIYLRRLLSNFHQRNTLSLKRNHLSLFLERVKTSGGGLRGVRSVLEGAWDGWVYRSGDLDKENFIKRIFQEIYLGEKFALHYHLKPLFYYGNGLYLNEKLLIEKGVLASLRKKMKLGIASGRPRFEAELALKQFRISHYFDSVVTLDDCEKEEDRLFNVTGKKVKLTKPHPYSILRAIRKIGLSNPRCGYVGDVVDDMRAAKAARKESNILAIGFLGSHTNRRKTKESLVHAGADLLLENPKDLLHVIN